MKKHVSILLESEMEKAEVVLAVKSLTNDLQTMAQKISKMQIEDVSAITERIKAEFGIQSGEDFNQNSTRILQEVLNTIQAGKSEIDNSALILSGDYSQSDSMFDNTSSETLASSNEDDTNMFAGHDASSGESSQPVGRVKKTVKENKAMDDALHQIDVAFGAEMSAIAKKTTSLAKKAELLAHGKSEMSPDTLTKFYNDICDYHTELNNELQNTDKVKELGKFVSYKGAVRNLNYAKGLLEKMFNKDKQSELTEMMKILERKGLTESSLYKKAMKLKEASTKAFGVFLKDTKGFDKKIDTVFFSPSMTEVEVKSSLINHDGYDKKITVVAESSRSEKEAINEAFTRKHFQMVADTLKTIEDNKKRKEMTEMHAKVFAQDNPRFDKAKFFKAADIADTIEESWDTEMETPKSKKGMFDGWTLKELESARKKLKQKETHTKAEATKLRQINFAIRAKRDWGKVEEAKGCKVVNVKKK